MDLLFLAQLSPTWVKKFLDTEPVTAIAALAIAGLVGIFTIWRLDARSSQKEIKELNTARVDDLKEVLPLAQTMTDASDEMIKLTARMADYRNRTSPPSRARG